MHDVNFGLLKLSHRPTKPRVFPPEQPTSGRHLRSLSPAVLQKSKSEFLLRLPIHLRDYPLIIHHYVLAGALCRNPDPWLLLLIQM
jgi:hypothetical protein